MPTFADWIDLPENRSARRAVECAVACVCSLRPRRRVNPLFLHGPSGTGKTHLLAALTTAVASAPDRTIALLSAGDLDPVRHQGDAETTDNLRAARQADLLLIEDVQRLPARGAEMLVQLVDYALARQRQLVLTGSVGPALLTELPARLTGRLAQGLVVGLQALSPESRRGYLAARSRQRGLSVTPDVLTWLAGHVAGSARPLEGALTRLEGLTRQQGRPATLGEVQAAFQAEGEAHTATVERIASRVGDYYRVGAKQLVSARRTRDTLLPRQVGMYLARQLTRLSLQQIGAYFGGRDHSTVLHACRKVEEALERDLALSGAVRQLHANLA